MKTIFANWYSQKQGHVSLKKFVAIGTELSWRRSGSAELSGAEMLWIGAMHTIIIYNIFEPEDYNFYLLSQATTVLYHTCSLPRLLSKHLHSLSTKLLKCYSEFFASMLIIWRAHFVTFTWLCTQLWWALGSIMPKAILPPNTVRWKHKLYTQHSPLASNLIFHFPSVCLKI